MLIISSLDEQLNFTNRQILTWTKATCSANGNHSYSYHFMTKSFLEKIMSKFLGSEKCSDLVHSINFPINSKNFQLSQKQKSLIWSGIDWNTKKNQKMCYVSRSDLWQTIQKFEIFFIVIKNQKQKFYIFLPKIRNLYKKIIFLIFFNFMQWSVTVN